MSKAVQPAHQPRNIVDSVGQRIDQFIQRGELHLPADYSPENALKAAWLTLQTVQDRNKRPALEVCTRESVYNSLLDMVVQGLNPAKKQGYFIVYGQQLVFQRSYFGDMALVKRVYPRADIWYGVVYEGDELTYTMERGRRVIQEHKQDLDNIDPQKIRAAYCVIEPGEGQPAHTEIMTIAQIRQSWAKSKQYNPKGGDTPHHTHPDQMALRTVIRRACKAVINSSSDDYLLLHHIHRSDEAAAKAEIEAEVAANANSQVIDVEPFEVAGESEPESEPEPAPEPVWSDVEEESEPEPVTVNSAPQQTAVGPDF